MGIRILLADDSVTAQNMGKKILSEAGHEVVTVSNGAAAAKKIAEMKPDLALLDVFMPGYSGLELCEKLRNAADTNRLPVILTVGKMEPYSPQDGARVKADGVIIKPFEATDLTAAVERLAQKLTSAPKAVARESKSTKPANYEATVRLDSKQIAEMLKSGGPEASHTESETPTGDASTPPMGTQTAEEFQVSPALDAPEAAMAAFAGEVAPAAEAAPATMNSYMQEYLSDTATVDAAIAASDAAEQSAANVPAPTELPVSRFEPQDSSDAPISSLQGFEPTAAAPIAEMPIVQEPGFEGTHQSSETATPISKDPALETDAHQATTGFPTKFGTPEADIYEAPMTNSSQELIAESDAMLDATISGHIDGGPQHPARPIDEFEARLQQAMAAYQAEPEPAAVAAFVPQPESEPTALVAGADEGGNNFESQVEAAMQTFESAAETVEPALDSEASESHLDMQSAASVPESPAEAVVAEFNEASVADAVANSEVTRPEAEPAFEVAHAAAPEADETVIEQMRESFSDLPVDGRSVPDLGSETDAIPRAMAAAAVASAPSLLSPSPESSQHEAAFEITRALSHAIGVESLPEAPAEPVTSQAEENEAGASNKMATAVERVLQRELPSLVWKVMAEIDLEKQKR